MKVKVRVFAMVKEKNNIGKNKRTAFEQSAQVLQGDDGYPDCPTTITHWDDPKGVLGAGVYAADLFFEAAPYGQMVPHLQNFQPDGVPAQRAPVRSAS
jgi:hypothetical protein